MPVLHHPNIFTLESGETLPELHIAYETYGKLNAGKDNVIWVFHALTGDAKPADWWNGLVGNGRTFDPDHHFIVCANMLGSEYGSTNANSIDPRVGKRFGASFPLITIRDMVAAHQLLQKHLGVDRISVGIGGSMGGQQLLEWAVADTALFEKIVVLATNAVHSPWAIAFNEAQRMALLADPTLWDESTTAGQKGLEAARAIGMLSYRHYLTYQWTQGEVDNEKTEGFRAASYQQHQGKKLSQRFHAQPYLSLSRSMDSHNLGRDRGGIEAALSTIKAKTLVIGIDTDVLFPIEEQQRLGKQIPGAAFAEIKSLYGHDGFLIEFDQIIQFLTPFLADATLELQEALSLQEKSELVLPGTETF